MTAPTSRTTTSAAARVPRQSARPTSRSKAGPRPTSRPRSGLRPTAGPGSELERRRFGTTTSPRGSHRSRATSRLRDRLRSPSAPVGDPRKIMPLNVWSSLLGIANLVCMATIPGLFYPDRNDLAVLAFVPFHLVWLALVLVNGRTSPRMILVQCLYATVSVTILGMSAFSPLVTLVCVTVNFLVPLSSAMSLTIRATRWLIVLAGIGNTLMVLDVGGNPVWLGVSAAAVTATGCIPALTVIDYRRRLNGAVDAARRLATTDPLTGLANRRGMSEAVVPLVHTALGTGAMVGVLVADLDHFKKVNDKYGHAGGDEVLRRVAKVIADTIRRGDLAARLGGEELAVVVLVGSAADLASLAERIRASVQVAGVQWNSTVSIGGVVADPAPRMERTPLPADMLGVLIDEADVLLYEAKNAGRNCVRVSGTELISTPGLE